MTQQRIKLINFFDHSYGRNVTFTVLMGFFALTLGSTSSALFLASTVFVIFFNPRVKPFEIWEESKALILQLPALCALPLFYIVAVLTSMQGEGLLLNTLHIAGSYWQLPVLIPFAIGLYYISKDLNFLGLFSKGCRYGLLAILPIALLQVFVFDVQAEGLSRHASTLASICLVATSISIIKWREDTQTDRAIAWAAFSAGVIIVVLTFLQSMLLPLSVVLFGAAVYLLKSTLSKNALTATLLIGASLLLVGFLSLSAFDKAPNVANIIKLETEQAGERSLEEYSDVNTSGFKAFIQRPLVGYGIRNVVDAANTTSQTDFANQDSSTYSHLHNAYLTYAVGGGFFLFLLLIATLAIPIFIIRATSKLKSDINTKFFGYMVVSVFGVLATVSTVLNNDQILTLFSMTIIFILVDYIQSTKGIMETRIPDLLIIAKGINPIGKR